jgi:hypothetical protein
MLNEADAKPSITQSYVHDDRHPNLTSLSGCSTGRSGASKESSFTYFICHENKPFFTETLEAKKAVSEPLSWCICAKQSAPRDNNAVLTK